MSEQIITKQCCKCKETKLVSEFSKNRTRKDGHMLWCKRCKKQLDKQYSQTEKGIKAHKRAILKYAQSGKKRAIDIAYRQTEKGTEVQRLAQQKYHQTEKGKEVYKRGIQKYRSKYPERRKAQIFVNNAIKAGKLPQPNTLQCKYCPKQAEQYHHPDYSKPLDVEPVCRSCHSKITHHLSPPAPLDRSLKADTASL